MNQGDHVRALRGGVWDHAIDLGDRTVIRFVPGRGLERGAYAGFTDGAEAVEVVVHRERVYRPPLVVARAFSRMAETAYAAMFVDPEQFAVWCKSGALPPATPEAAPATPRRARSARAAAAPARFRARAAGKGRKARPAARSKPGSKSRSARPARKKPAPRKKAAGRARRPARPARPVRKPGKTARRARRR